MSQNTVVILTLFTILLVLACSDPVKDPPAGLSKIYYFGNGEDSGTGPKDDQAYAKGETAQIKDQESLTKEGYYFSSWNTERDGTGFSCLPNENIVIGSEDMLLYAQWIAEPTYSIRYLGNGHTSGIEPQDKENYLESEQAVILPPGSLTKEGAYFTCWNSHPHGQGLNFYPGETLTVGKEDIQLFAQWEIFKNQLYLWEADVDQSGTDYREFIEIWNNTGQDISFAESPDSYFLLFINGSDNLTYNQPIALDGLLPDGDVFLIGTSEIPDIDAFFPRASNSLQNGVDAILLIKAAKSQNPTADHFPNDTKIDSSAQFAIGETTYEKVDGLVYHTGDSDNPELWEIVGTYKQFDEDFNLMSEIESLGRQTHNDWTVQSPSPGLK